jgi:hypothetical protein
MGLGQATDARLWQVLSLRRGDKWRLVLFFFGASPSSLALLRSQLPIATTRRILAGLHGGVQSHSLQVEAAHERMTFRCKQNVA